MPLGQSLIGDADETVESLAVSGQLHLGATVIAARAQDKTTVKTHLAEARRLAYHTGEAGHVHWLSFGPTNVQLHEVSADVELRHYGKAATDAAAVTMPNSWPLSRRAHFYVDKARAEMEIGRTESALEDLVTARKMAPQQTRYHPGARETIKGLVHKRRTTPDTLDSMAAWIGL